MDLPQLIASAIGSERYLVGLHAQRRLRERLIELWQIEAGVTGWIVEEVRPDDLPNPSIVCKQTLPDVPRSPLSGPLFPKTAKRCS